jgi:hypothetical protein
MKPRIYYDNALDDGAIVATTADTGTAADNLADWRPYTWYTPASLPATVTVDCGSARACNYALVLGHTLFTSGAGIEVRASTDNFVASDLLIASNVPTSNGPVLLHFTAVSYRYWRLRITGAAVMPSLAIAAVGTFMELPGYLGLSFDPTARSVQAQTNLNMAGQPLGKVIEFTQQRRTLSLRMVTPAWIRGTFLPAWRTHLRSAPFALAWNVTDDPTNVVLCVAGDELKTPHSPGLTADIEFDITNTVDD